MNLKHQDVIIDPETPFKNCRLNREPFAEVLTSIVKKYTNGFVLAINNEWGTGKTTFVKMWKQYLEKQKFKTLYFNAWENDFENDPLIALMSELDELKDEKTENTFKKVTKKAVPFVKKLVPSLIKNLAFKYIGDDAMQELANDSTDVISEELSDEIEAYTTKKKGIKDFQESLKVFIEETSKDKPVIFVIDELDRCRPNYAVETLEKIKHLFNVPGIVFVLALDKTQLEAAICGVYGSDKIDAKEYLRRFIDIELALPKPDTYLFSEYLYKYFQFDLFFDSEERKNYRELQKDGQRFLHFSRFLFISKALSLRVQEKLLAHAKLVLNTFNANNYVFPQAVVFLIYLKNLHPLIYKCIKERTYSYQELVDAIEKIFIGKLYYKNYNEFATMEAMLLQLYHNFYREINLQSELMERGASNESTLLVKTNVDIDNAQNDLSSFVKHFLNKHETNSIQLDYFIKKIDLTEPII